MNEKWLKACQVFDEYEKRFAAARAEKPLSRPWEEGERERIRFDVMKMLGWREELLPEIGELEEQSRTSYGSYDAIQYRYGTWAHFYGAATLYLPRREGKLPLVFVCCGHGGVGRLTDSYMAMGHRLAQLGMAAMVVDNIGQGDRNFRSEEQKNSDHWMAIAPFRSGLTLQGLIVMETVALIRHMTKDPRFDPARFGACGNSGGGTLTMFLSALAPELSAVASTGYPSELGYLLTKERRHCSCNLLLGAAHRAEMWEIYSLFAPKPLFLESGKHDNLIPQDVALRNVRKVENTYVQFNQEENFSSFLAPTRHSWELADINPISAFLAKHLTGEVVEDAEALFSCEDLAPFRVTMPADMLSTDELVYSLTGIKTPAQMELWDVFPPRFHGEVLDPDSIQRDLGRGDVMRVFAQFECTLLKPDSEKE